MSRWKRCGRIWFFLGSFGDGIVTAVWSVDPPDYIDDTGRFLSEPPKEGILATVKVTLTCGKEELIREFPVKLLPPERTELEEKAVELKAEAEENGEKTREAEEMVLPDSWKGPPSRWGTREVHHLEWAFFCWRWDSGTSTERTTGN